MSAERPKAATQAQVSKGPGKEEATDAMTLPMQRRPLSSVISLSTLIGIFCPPDSSDYHLKTARRTFLEEYSTIYRLDRSIPGPDEQSISFYLCELPCLVPLLLYHFEPDREWRTRLTQAIQARLLWKDAKRLFVLGLEYWRPWVSRANRDNRAVLRFFLPCELRFHLRDLCQEQFWWDSVRRGSIDLRELVSSRPFRSDFRSVEHVRATLVWYLESGCDGGVPDDLKRRQVEFIVHDAIEPAMEFYDEVRKRESIEYSFLSVSYRNRTAYFKQRKPLDEIDENGELQWNPALYVRILDRCQALASDVPSFATVCQAVKDEFGTEYPHLNDSALAETAGIYPEICRIAVSCTFLDCMIEPGYGQTTY